MQKTLTEKEAGKLASMGIECFVRCTSNKVDQAKEDVRSLCLNFDIKGKDSDGDTRNLGKGNNLNINNLTPGDYEQLCKLFGVNKIDDGTPMVAVLYHAADFKKAEAWKVAMARGEKEIPEDQADVTGYDAPEDVEPEGTITKKQLKFINDLTGKLESDQLIEDALKEAAVNVVNQLSKEDASELIKKVKAAIKKE